MFWGFVLRLAVGAFIAPIVFSFMLMPLFGVLALTVRRNDSKLAPLGYPVVALAFVFQLYFWGLWASYCAGLAVFRASHPDVTHARISYVVAFIFVTAPLGYLASKEQMWAGSPGEVRGIQRGSILYKGVTIAAFILFALWPGLMAVPYGWFLGLAVPMEARAVQGLEQKYFETLDTWVARGGRVLDVEDTVVQTCGKLVMLNVASAERLRLSTTEREEFHFRVDVCTKRNRGRPSVRRGNPRSCFAEGPIPPISAEDHPAMGLT